MKGRIPKPTILNELKGDPGKRRRHTKEPKPKSGMPHCPEHLDDIAKEEWQFITEQLADMGLLSVADSTSIELYCSAYSRYRQAEEKVRRYGEVIVSPGTKYPMVSPYVSVMNKNLDQCRRMLIEFGLTPSARARMRISKNDGEQSEIAQRFIMRVTG